MSQSFEGSKRIYYLESIARNLKELATIARGHGHSIGSEVLADNRDWLDCYIETLKRPVQQSGGAPAYPPGDDPRQEGE